MRWLALLWCLWLLYPVATQAKPESPIVTLDRAGISSNPSSTPPRDAQRWVALPHDWTNVEAGFTGHHWYLLTFDDPAVALPAFYIERGCTNVELWINGTLVKSGGRMSEPLTRNCYYPQLFELPRMLLKPRDNQLAIRVAGYPLAQVTARQRLGGLSALHLGPEPELRARYESQLFWKVTVARIIGAVLALFGVFMLMLGRLRAGDRFFYHIGFAMIGWAALGTRLYLRDIPLPGMTAEIVITSLFPPVVYAAVQFLIHYVRRQQRWITLGLALQCVIVPPALLLAAPDHLFALASVVYTLLAVEFVAALLFFGWHSWHTMRADFWLIGAAEFMAALLAVAEIGIQNHWLPLPKIHLLHFAGPLILMVIGARLTQQFAQAINRSEQMNAELERRVAEKSAELEDNFATLSELRAAEATLRERQRIASDLHDDLGAKLLTLVYRAEDKTLAGVARSALQDLRDVVSRLSHGPLSLGALATRWQAEAEERLDHAEMALRWQQAEDLEEVIVTPLQGYHLERILREALSNAIKHAGANQVTIALALDPNGNLLASIQDDGKDFGETPAVGNGIGNMSARAKTLGADIIWQRTPSGGCEVLIKLPLPPVPAAEVIN